MDEQARERRKARQAGDHDLGVSFFTEMEMAHQRVLKKMKRREAEYNIEGSKRPHEIEALRDQIEEDEREKEPCAQRDQILLDLFGPFFPQDDQRPAENFGGGGDQSEQNNSGH